ncbi:S-adenosyl-L-methionine-dependent methyltransferase [Massarina eburnea CBS 473.64]|uniref:S-adenosyl-L-methionine-dependent methyltransferase n=1 Tax=Massarina eburnea CBS 473.64 TaxID=1395130 RepID=A0A6A6RQR0_9PLEO|nr:S-adenosyl-L-methionine-dependent methyltransferase [Massarina eburnea CBS 473.64]
MEEEPPPQPDDPASDHTAAQHKRARSNSDSSVSAASLHSTRTLHDEDLEFVHENGRIYGNDSYYMPCDQPEQDRLTLQHQIYLLALKGKLTTTKVSPKTSRILDLGTGPGDWAVGMAKECPWAEVVGIDMAVWDLDITETTAGDTEVRWEIDNLDVWGIEDEFDDIVLRMERVDLARDLAERDPVDSPARPRAKTSGSNTQPQTPAESAYDLYVLNPDEQPGWHFSDSYDLIHMRGMKGVFGYWEGVYEEVYKTLSPGGWVEVVDYHIDLPQMEQETRNPASFPFPTLAKLHLALLQASVKSGRPLGTYYMHPSYLSDAGFKDVSTTYVNVPIGQWPEDEEQRKIGKLFMVCVMEMLEAHLLRPLTVWGDAERVWSVDEVRSLIVKAKEEILEWNTVMEERREPGRRSVFAGWEWKANFKWIIGRKPLYDL